MNRGYRVLAAIGLAVMVGGCVFYRDSDELTFQGSSRDAQGFDLGGRDVDVTDASGGDDAGPDDGGLDVDAHDMPADGGGGDVALADVGFGETCPGATTPAPGLCNPVRQTGCRDDEFCGLGLGQGEPPTLEPRCFDVRGDVTYDGRRGDACMAEVVGDNSGCEPGFQCSFTSVCLRLCELETAAGCQREEQCREFTEGLTGYGVCDDGC